jgi:hypothetical protein
LVFVVQLLTPSLWPNDSTTSPLVGYLAIYEALNSEYKNAIQVLDNPVVKKRWCLSGRFTSNAFLAFLILHILCRPSRKIERERERESERARVRVSEREREREIQVETGPRPMLKKCLGMEGLMCTHV